MTLSFISKVLAADTAYPDPIGKVDTSNVAIWSTPAIDPATGQLVGIISIFNMLLRILFAVAGIWAFVNFILAGIGFISAQGDPKKIEAAWSRIWQSVLGLVIIVASFLFAAIIGLILFKDASYILNPRI